MRIGIDSYGLLPLGLAPMDVLRWALDHGAEGVQFSGLSEEEGKCVDGAYLDDMAMFAAEHDLYLEWGGGRHIPLNMGTWQSEDIFAPNQNAAVQASRLGTRVVRSCSGGMMRWSATSPSTEALLELAAGALREQRSMLKDHGVVLALETHFEFTTFELLRLFEMCDTEPGEYLGICLDTMNLLTMLEDPLAAAHRLLPWVVATHVKDGGILLRDEGIITFPCRIGTGVVDLDGIFGFLQTLPQEVTLSIEDHGGEFMLPIFDPRFLDEFPDLTLEEYVELGRLTRSTEKRLRQGSLEMTSREEWPTVCEDRIVQDLAALKAMGSSPSNTP